MTSESSQSRSSQPGDSLPDDLALADLELDQDRWLGVVRELPDIQVPDTLTDAIMEEIAKQPPYAVVDTTFDDAASAKEVATAEAGSSKMTQSKAATSGTMSYQTDRRRQGGKVLRRFAIPTAAAAAVLIVLTQMAPQSIDVATTTLDTPEIAHTTASAAEAMWPWGGAPQAAQASTEPAAEPFVYDDPMAELAGF